MFILSLQNGSNRLTDILNGQQLQIRAIPKLPMSRHHTAFESQTPHFGYSLRELADSSQLSGKSYFPDGCQVTGDGLVQIAGG